MVLGRPQRHAHRPPLRPHQGEARRVWSFLAAEVIGGYVERELAISGMIERGREEVRAGRVTPHDEVTREADTTLEAASAKA